MRDTTFRWMQLSDLHYPGYGGCNTERIRKDLIRYISHTWQPSDFDSVVMAGDIFHQGKESHDIRLFLKELYAITVDPDCEIGALSKMLLCPGNHDIDRWMPQQRQETLLKAIERIDKVNDTNPSNPSSNLNEPEEQLLVKETFQNFYDFAKDITGRNYDKNAYCIDVVVPNSRFPINFTIINTSIFAGQTATIKEIAQNKICEQALFEKTREKSYDLASIHWAKMKSWEQAEINHAKKQTVIDDEKLYFPYMQHNDLVQDRKMENCVNIVIGHHSYEMLSTHGKIIFENFLRSVDADLYCCGHIHQSDEYRLPGNSPWQISSGGLFSDGYAIPSFFVGELDALKKELRITLYTYRKLSTHSQSDYKWAIESHFGATDTGTNTFNRFTGFQGRPKEIIWPANQSAEIFNESFKSILDIIKNLMSDLQQELLGAVTKNGVGYKQTNAYHKYHFFVHNILLGLDPPSLYANDIAKLINTYTSTITTFDKLLLYQKNNPRLIPSSDSPSDESMTEELILDQEKITKSYEPFSKGPADNFFPK